MLVAATTEPLASALFAKTRRVVLGLFFTHPDEWFHLRQVVRLSGAGMGAVQREVTRLAKAGILERQERGNQVAYRADPRCPIFADLKSLLVKTAGVADVLRPALLPLGDRVQLAFLYGSFARGEQHRSSDVDVLVVGTATFSDVVAALQEAQATLGREVNPSVYPPEEFSRKLADRHPFLTRVVDGDKVFLIGDERELGRLGQQRLAAAAHGRRAGDR